MKVVSDSTPLIAFSRIDKLGMLCSYFWAQATCVPASSRSARISLLCRCVDPFGRP